MSDARVNGVRTCTKRPARGPRFADTRCWLRYSKIAVWNSLVDENDYPMKRWTEFLNA